MYPVILRVVVVEPGGGEILQNCLLVGVMVEKNLFVRNLSSSEEFFKVKIYNTHVDESKLYLGSEHTTNRVMTVLASDGFNDSRIKHISMKSKDSQIQEIRKQIDALHQFYNIVIPYTV